MACAPSKDSYQPGHPPSLMRVFTVRLKKAKILSYPLSAQQRLWSDWVDAQADLSLHLAHMPFCWFCHEAAQIVHLLPGTSPVIHRTLDYSFNSSIPRKRWEIYGRIKKAAVFILQIIYKVGLPCSTKSKQIMVGEERLIHSNTLF